MSQSSFTFLLDIDECESPHRERGSVFLWRCWLVVAQTVSHKHETVNWETWAAHSKTHEELKVVESQAICISGQGPALKQSQKDIYLFGLENRAVLQIHHLETTALLGTLCGSSKTVKLLLLGDKTPINVKGSKPGSVLPLLLTVTIFQFREENLPMYFSVSNCSVKRNKHK